MQKLAATGQESVAIAATTKLAMSGAQVDLGGTVGLDVQGRGRGMTLALKGQTQLSAEAPITSFGKDMTSVKGQIVEVSGALVKLG